MAQVTSPLDSRLEVISCPDCRLHSPNAHPEIAARLDWAFAGMGLAGWVQGARVPERPLGRDTLELVHTRDYLRFLESYAAAGGGMVSVDTEMTGDSYRVATLASAAVWLGVEQSLAALRPSLALIRPPGHHAGPATGMGFCLINHAAVAGRMFQERYARPGSGRARVAIIDWDVHHGNGTAAVFAADPDCLYVSIHESPLYPYTGWLSETGSGPGEGTTVNLPLPGELTAGQAVEAYQRVVLPCVRQYRPEAILVSAGLDGHWSDPMSSWQLTASCYYTLASLTREAALALGVPLVALLEGGYSQKGLSLGIAAIAAGLGGVAPVREVVSDTVMRGGTQHRQAALYQARLDDIVSFQRRYFDLA